MADGYIESKGAVQVFLNDLKIVLNDPKSDLTIEPREDKEEEYRTDYCLTTLMYDKKDVEEELKNLKLKDYVETCDDDKNKKSNRFYVFGIKRENREIYVKVKIESYDNKTVLCLSFHFAEYPIKWVY